MQRTQPTVGIVSRLVKFTMLVPSMTFLQRRPILHGTAYNLTLQSIQAL